MSAGDVAPYEIRGLTMELLGSALRMRLHEESLDADLVVRVSEMFGIELRDHALSIPFHLARIAAEMTKLYAEAVDGDEADPMAVMQSIALKVMSDTDD